MRRKWTKDAYIAYYGMTKEEIISVVERELHPDLPVKVIFDKPVKSVLQMKNHLQRYI